MHPDMEESVEMMKPVMMVMAGLVLMTAFVAP